MSHPLRLFGLLTLLGAFGPGIALPLEPLPYNHPGLAVDLGVGLWAWPLPCDADGDGDFDLVVSCPDKPSNGVYLFENATGDTARDAFPVFKPGRRIGPAAHYVMPSYAEGRMRVLTPGREHPDFLKAGIGEGVKLPLAGNFHTPTGPQPKGPRLRHNQWRYVDHDGDADLDLVVAVEDWSHYGWDDAWNERGEWTHGPLHGWIYLVRNTGTAERPVYAEPTFLEAGGRRLDVFGCPSPNFEDFDGDGDLDLLCGEFLDSFTYFENIGTRTEPRYAAGRRVKDAVGNPVSMELEMIVPVAFDWDRDGDADLVVGDEDGRVALVQNEGSLAADRTPVFAQPRYFRQEADRLKCGALATPVGFDWDGDGDQDIVSGNTAGFIEWFENLSGPAVAAPTWAAPRRLEAGGKVFRIMAGNRSIQGPAEAKWGYTTLSIADWDVDGLPDIVLNSITGDVQWLRNVGTRRAPALAAPQPVEVAWAGPPPALAWGWLKPSGKALLTQWRTTPVAHDFDGDGLPDLAILDTEGYLVLFRRARRDGELVLEPPRRAFVDDEGRPLRLTARTAGGSGRRKLCVADWDGDGRVDLLLNSANADLLRGIDVRDGTWAMRKTGPLATKNIEGHDVSPATVDFDGNGVPDFLGGAEDGRFYFLANPRAATPSTTERSTTPGPTGLEPVTVELWPNGTPTAMRPRSPATEKLFQSLGGRADPSRVTDVTTPTMVVYPSGRPNSPAVIVAPGGGFMFLSSKHEGTEVCEWLNSLGITAVLLKYRTPTRDEPEHFTLPVQDAQRAMGILRHRAAEWQIDPRRVGLLGFSAGANLAGHAAWDRGDRAYAQEPGIDDPRGPDFLVFIYGGGFLDPDAAAAFRPGFSVPKDAPPAIFICAHDDKRASVEAAMLFLEYTKQGIPAELHVFAKGGHGFGMRRAGNPVNDWPARVAEWMASMGFTAPPARTSGHPSGSTTSTSMPGAVPAAPPAGPCRIAIVEKGTGWPVPLVELETVHGVKFVSDNAGLIAFDLPEAMGRETWCGVRGFGYAVPKDGFGNEGVRITPRPGGRLTLEVERRIVAKRLGRLTGAGLFAESQKLGEHADWEEQGVVGCDSVQNAVVDGRLFWLWGDTSLAKYPLGIFDGTAARTPLRPLDRLEPPLRIPFDYVKDPTGAPKPIARMSGSGPTWVTGVTSVRDAAGAMRLVGTFTKIKPPLDAYKAGLCVWDPAREQFLELKTVWERSDAGRRQPPLPEGHPVAWTDPDGASWLLFGNPFPSIRCPATFEAWSDPRTWESLEAPASLRAADGTTVEPHSGSIAWNPWRRCWVAIFMERLGKPSAFGELWYAEAASPLGPWAAAVKVVSHDNYTFYNPRIHPEFTGPESSALVFEATFTRQFADRPAPVARYDYNQVLYRLDLDDAALKPARAR